MRRRVGQSNSRIVYYHSSHLTHWTKAKAKAMRMTHVEWMWTKKNSSKIICSIRCILVAHNLWQWQFKCLTFSTTFYANILLLHIHLWYLACKFFPFVIKKSNKKIEWMWERQRKTKAQKVQKKIQRIEGGKAQV